MDINLNKRYKDTELERMVILDAYYLICNGKYYKKFHNSFWQNRTRAREDAITLTKHVFSSMKNIRLDDLPSIVTKQTFVDLKLDSMLKQVFNDSVRDALMSAFPNDFHMLQFDEALPKEFTDENSADAVRWLVETKLNLKPSEAMEKLKVSTFSRYHLITMFVKTYKSDLRKALEAAYPNEYHNDRKVISHLRSIIGW